MELKGIIMEKSTQKPLLYIRNYYCYYARVSLLSSRNP